MRRIAFAAVLLAATMDHLDGSIVNVVLPILQRQLGANASAAQWIASGYTLTFGLFLITSGRLGDLVGHKRLLLLGIGGFTTSSVLCGLAADPAVMIGARLCQGLASAAMVPQLLALVPALFPGPARARALGIYAGVTGVAAVGGQLLGAVLTEIDLLGLGWRAIFLINAPTGLLAWLGAVLAMPDSRWRQPVHLDLTGVALATTGLLLITGPLTLVHRTGWSLWHAGSLAAAVVVVALFVRHQRRRPGTALVPPHLMRIRAFTTGLSITFGVFVTIHAFFFTQVLYLQQGLGRGALDTALIILPWAVGTSVGAAFASSRLVPRFGARVLDVGLLLLAVGFASVALGLSSGYAHWALSLGLAGLGMGCVVAPVLGVALREAPSDDVGIASGLISSAQQVGGVLGSAGLGAVYFAIAGAGDAPTAFRAVVWCAVVVQLTCLAVRVHARV